MKKLSIIITLLILITVIIALFIDISEPVKFYIMGAGSGVILITAVVYKIIYRNR